MLEVIFSLIGDLYINFKDYIFEDLDFYGEKQEYIRSANTA